MLLWPVNEKTQPCKLRRGLGRITHNSKLKVEIVNRIAAATFSRGETHVAEARALMEQCHGTAVAMLHQSDKNRNSGFRPLNREKVPDVP